MRVVLLAVGSRGDVQPYISLGLGLKVAGHRVRIVTHEEFRHFITGHGLDYGYIPGNIHELIGSETGQAWLKSGDSVVAFMHRYPKLIHSFLDTFLDDAWNACQDAECIMYSIFGSAGYHIAEALGIPCICTPLQPITRTHAFPFMGGFRTGNIRSLNYVTYLMSEQLFWQPVRKMTNVWRVRTLKIPPLSFWGPFDAVYEHKQPHLYGISPSVLPKPDDWPDNHHITGYWFLDGSKSWQPSPDLQKFLASGPDPIYIGFGSMVARDPEEMIDVVVKALQMTEKRGIVAAGWSTLAFSQRDDIYVTDSVPHDWLFPKVAAVIHHGGAGTTAAGLRAGIPSVILPFFADQPFWGKRVAELGVGPRPIMQKNLTARHLADAIMQATTNKHMITRAAELGRQIRSENGVSRAVEAFHQCVA
jgi:sterol 3beta-glucosyltransferase